MVLNELLNGYLSSAILTNAADEKRRGDFSQLFASSTYIGFYFHQELNANINANSPTNAIVSSPEADNRRQLQQQSSHLFLVEQMKGLLHNLRVSDSNGNSKKPGPCNFAVVIISSASATNSEHNYESTFVRRYDLRDENFWILPLQENYVRATLLRAYKIQYTPALIIVDARTRRTVAVDGRRALQADPYGRRFPWHLPEPSDVFQGALLGQNGKTTDVAEFDGSMKCLLFAAHWCPPCRAFVKQLSQMYERLKQVDAAEKENSMEIIYCSMDRSEEAFTQFYNEMPWLAFPFNDPRCIAAARLYNIQEIPTLLVLDKDDQLITRHGKTELALDPFGAEFPWYPKLVLDLNSHTVGRLREDISLLLFTEGAAEDLTFAQTSLLPVADEFLMKDNAGDNHMLFFYCAEDPISDQIWENLGLGDASLPLICITDPFTDNLYVCDDPNVSEAIIRRFVEQVLQGALSPTRRLSPAVNRNQLSLKTSTYVGGDDAANFSSNDNECNARKLCVNSSSNVQNLNSKQRQLRYCL